MKSQFPYEMVSNRDRFKMRVKVILLWQIKLLLLKVKNIYSEDAATLSYLSDWSCNF